MSKMSLLSKVPAATLLSMLTILISIQSMASDTYFGSPAKLLTRGEYRATKKIKFKEFDRTYDAYLDLIIKDASPEFLQIYPICGSYDYPVTQTFKLVSVPPKQLESQSATRLIEVDLSAKQGFQFTDVFFAGICQSALTTFNFTNNFQKVRVDFSRLKDRGYYDKLDFKFNGTDIVVEGPLTFIRKD